jgi:hypothetical protein
MAQQRMMQRYGIGMGRGGEGASPLGGVQYHPLGSAPAQPVYATPAPGTVAPGTAPGNKGGLQTVLDEKQLKVTINFILIKLLPEKTVATK